VTTAAALAAERAAAAWITAPDHFGTGSRLGRVLLAEISAITAARRGSGLAPSSSTALILLRNVDSCPVSTAGNLVVGIHAGLDVLARLREQLDSR
jgi:hypothetical protein